MPRAVLLLTLMTLLALARTSLAEEPKKADAQKSDTEVDPLPLFGGDTDVGVGGGAVVDIVRHEPGHKPNRWSLEVAGLAMFKPPVSSGGPIQIPFQDYYVRFQIPDLLNDTLRLEVRPSFTSESTLKYYGMGNASALTRPSLNDPYYEYGRAHPALLVRARLRLRGPFFVVVGDAFTYHALDVQPGTSLANDAQNGSPEVRRLLGSFRDHATNVFEYSLAYDTRDNEVEPESGMWDEVGIRLSPGGASFMPYRYGQGNVTLRGYVTPIPKRLTFAARVVADWQFGDVPFFELARYDETYALGGVNGVRGVPAQRYYGKEKIFGNVEARATLVTFQMFEKDFGVGVAGFFDAGRLWADGFNHPELDGSGAGLKYGVGGGLRLRQGTAMVVRLDVAWSPDAQPVSAYFSAGEMF